MSEYKYVEKPFLEQLSQLGWETVDCGIGIPGDPERSFRTSFREVLLKSRFKQAVSSINKTEDGEEWLTDDQLEDLHRELLAQSGKSLVEANRDVLELIYRSSVSENTVTGERDPNVKIIDFENPENNDFLAINQFRVDTPGRVKDFICPDIVLFVNGLPLVVVEAKDSNAESKDEGGIQDYSPYADPMHEAYVQLRRYSNQREETKAAGLFEGDERLFWFNQLMVTSCGEEARFGSVTSTEEYFYGWKSIYPEKYAEYEKPLGKERPQEMLIQGMLPKDTLLDIIKHFTVFKTEGKKLIKIVCRYQQYRAVLKTTERLVQGKTATERSGVVWHTQGSGKSLTMAFLIKRLHGNKATEDFKVLAVTDRTSLENQLKETISLIDSNVDSITSSKDLEKLKSDASDLHMVMVHKFKEYDNKDLPEYVEEALKQNYGKVLKDEGIFGVINNSDRIIILIDEAHRTQGGDFNDNLFAAFPNGARIAFTGTPLITDRHTKKTTDRFGTYIDKYKLMDAVEDGATKQILYEGRSGDGAIYERDSFDRKFEDLFKDRTEEELLAIRKRWGATGDILDAEKLIEAKAKDMVEHYIKNILPNGFKAQVVCNSKLAAVRYQQYIDKALSEYIDSFEVKEGEDENLLERIKFLKTAVVISSEGTNEKAVYTNARKEAKKNKAVDNFKEDFDLEKEGGVYKSPLTGIAFLIVCDMLLTGFDAPIEQVMYIDKKIKEHNLLQTIARVNRPKKGKTRGYIVDYVGLTSHLKQALAIYAGEEYEDAVSSLKDISAEIPVLEERYQRILNLFRENGLPEAEQFIKREIKDASKEYEVLEKIVDLFENVRLRSDFEVFFKKFTQSMDIILPKPPAHPYKSPMKRLGYILSCVKKRYKDTSLNIRGAGQKVRQLIDEHLISLGIDPKIPPVELLSSDFIEEVSKNQSSKAKASEMEHAIRKHCKVHFDEDPALYEKFSEKLDATIKKYHDQWEQLCLALSEMTDEVRAGREGTASNGLAGISATFHERIAQLAFSGNIPGHQNDKLIEVTEEVVSLIRRTINIVDFWGKKDEVKKLRGEINDRLLYSGIDELIEQREQIATELTGLAKTRKSDLKA